MEEVGKPQAPVVSEGDLRFLRRSFELAALGLGLGEAPFGAMIVDRSGTVIAEAYACALGQSDVTAHAEVEAIRKATHAVDRERLAGCTLYASAEPCAMCAGAIHWSNIRRVVFGLGEARLRGLRGASAAAYALTIGCASVLATGGHPIMVIGPALEDEAAPSHVAFWSRRKG